MGFTRREFLVGLGAAAGGLACGQLSRAVEPNPTGPPTETLLPPIPTKRPRATNTPEPTPTPRSRELLEQTLLVDNPLFEQGWGDWAKPAPSFVLEGDNIYFSIQGGPGLASISREDLKRRTGKANWISEVSATPVIADETSVFAIRENLRIYKVNKANGEAELFAYQPKPEDMQRFAQDDQPGWYIYPFFQSKDYLAVHGRGGSTIYIKETNQILGKVPRDFRKPRPYFIGPSAGLEVSLQPSAELFLNLRRARWDIGTKDGSGNFTLEDTYADILLGESGLAAVITDRLRLIYPPEEDEEGYKEYDYSLSEGTYKPVLVTPDLAVVELLWPYAESTSEYAYYVIDSKTGDTLPHLEGPGRERIDFLGAEGSWVFSYQAYPGILWGYDPLSRDLKGWWNDEVQARQYLGKSDNTLIFGNLYRPFAEKAYDPAIMNQVRLIWDMTIEEYRNTIPAQVYRNETKEPVDNPQVLGLDPETGKERWTVPISSPGRVRGILNKEAGKVVVATRGQVMTIDAGSGEISYIQTDFPPGEPLHLTNWGELVVLQTEDNQLLILKP